VGFPIAARFAHPDAGYEAEQERAARLLEPGKVYVVKRLEVGRSDSALTVWLDGAEGPAEQFSTVLFEPAATPSDWDDDEPKPGASRMSTAGELGDYLSAQPRDQKVVLRKDAEGNDHSPLAEAWEGMYVADSTWSGETYPTPEDLAEAMTPPNLQGWSDEDAAPEGAERVIVLGPVN
jgi:hypothetical protein